MDEVLELREEYEAALDEAEAKRAAYHRAVVKLHLSGLPLRDIAEGLGISHQRVHQIVTGEPQRTKRRGGRLARGVVAGLMLLAASGVGLVAGLNVDHETQRVPPGLAAVPNVVGLRLDQAVAALAGSDVCLSRLT